jgi:hypothetical protein
MAVPVSGWTGGLVILGQVVTVPLALQRLAERLASRECQRTASGGAVAQLVTVAALEVVPT